MSSSRVSRSAARPPGRRLGASNRQTAAGWLFVTPMLIILGLFLVLPIVMALWVSVSDWRGRGNPFAGGASFVGFENYSELLGGGGLPTRDFGTAIRNNLYYVLLVVPIQTMLSLLLAVMVNQRLLRGRGFFRTALYFPSVTSSVAITVVFLFLFNATGAVNRLLSYLSVNGPNWVNDPRGVLHIIFGAFGVEQAPEALNAAPLLGISWWQWLAGPSITMCIYIVMAIFTTSGTFMLLFLAALQNISGDIEEAAMVDGATGWQRLWKITVPMLRPTTFTVITLGLIGTWQLFDQIYTGTQGAPSKTTLTPAFLSYQASFISQRWGQGAAIAFLLFAIIVILTIFQRLILRDKELPRRKRFYPDGLPPGSGGGGPALTASTAAGGLGSGTTAAAAVGGTAAPTSGTPVRGPNRGAAPGETGEPGGRGEREGGGP